MKKENQKKPVKILFTEFVTHDVKRFILEKPKGYRFTPGQATLISINKPSWKTKKHPFTFTSRNTDLILEFTIKIYPVKKYPDHQGMTEKLASLKPGDQLIIRESWGTINYQGKGMFLAASAGITPFIAILRDLKNKSKLQGNQLIFSNKTKKDIILEKELKEIFPKHALTLTLTREKPNGYRHGRINKMFLKKKIKDKNLNFYTCGPPSFVKDTKKALKDLSINTQDIVFEK